MSLSTKALLTPELRSRLAADQDLGLGNLLRSAIAVNPHPDVPFITSARPIVNSAGQEQTEFSLLDIDRLAQSWSVWYLSRGVGPRDRVAIFIEDTFAYTIHVHALTQIGAIAVLINSNVTKDAALALCRQTGAIGLYTDRGRLARLGDEIGTLTVMRFVQLVEELPAPPTAELRGTARFHAVGEDPAVILHSSGTTGLPKPVTHTHATIAAGPQYRLANFTESPESLMMAAQPQSRVGSIGYAIYAVLAGTPMIALYDPTGPELLSAVIRYQPTMVLAFAHAYSDLAAMEIPDTALDSVIGWISMADAVHEAHMKKILGLRSTNLPQEAVFYDRFGSSELGWGLMVAQRRLSTDRSDRRMGVPDSLAEFAVLRPDGSKAAVGEFGLIGVKSPTVTVGYWSDSDLTCRSKLAGYWLSGDIGYQDEEGTYFQVDRAVDVIGTGSGPGYSVLMEELLLAEVPDILDCAVVAGKHLGRTVPVAVITSSETTVDPKSTLKQANAALRAAGHPELALLEVARNPEDLPIGVTGKVLKRQLRHKYESLEHYLTFVDDRCLATVLA
jgi:acyl-coenzyme A synthetase/AMP-(fatty) acid ligase